jgi:hypothetical protein
MGLQFLILIGELAGATLSAWRSHESPAGSLEEVWRKLFIIKNPFQEARVGLAELAPLKEAM